MTQHIFDRYFQALAQRDLNTILDCFATTLDWHIPGDETLAPWVGTRSSKKEIAEFFALLWQETEPVAGEIFHSFTQGNTNLTAGRFVTRMLRTDRVYTSLFFTEITIHEGLIIKYRLLEDTNGLVQALSA
ncbi:nuclear transport factor 2 family protein [Chitinophaga pendula]|uniref:nuclear transport factor 2 family protein n=1 Tax=Chitinophaga TaxID=79328 RepID=UPI000BB0B108|nr:MULTISPECIES: nuclear transport factor 2 family protein [Chitinophaga]ASZ11924.1 hypothetical protein CK934_13625 [Chitinophaga sp. MD30]UCJ05049.1 nuclear transport factor 2 family protein [Chitinophaga pendula]